MDDDNLNLPPSLDDGLRSKVGINCGGSSVDTLASIKQTKLKLKLIRHDKNIKNIFILRSKN